MGPECLWLRAGTFWAGGRNALGLHMGPERSGSRKSRALNTGPIRNVILFTHILHVHSASECPVYIDTGIIANKL